jgi:hypothetical protein
VVDRGATAGPLSPRQVEEWRRNLDAIIRDGDESVAAIAGFLATKQDTVFNASESEALGFNSAREALLDALARISGPQAISAMAVALADTVVPAEVAMLARNLDALAPETYRQNAMSAARESLVAAIREPAAGTDVAPLFEVLLQYGGVEAAADLERAASHWGHYATLALAAVPDGAGVPSLMHIAESAPGRAPHPARLQALQVIAQLALSNEQARASLLGLAREKQIPAPLWPYLARPLAGEQARLQNPLLEAGDGPPEDSHAGTVHITSGNQNLIWTKAPAGLSADQQNGLASLLRELVAVTKDPDGLRILQQTLAGLETEDAHVSGVLRSD